MLFPPASTLIRLSLSNEFTIPAYSKRSSVPAPAATRPKTPLFFSSEMVRFMVLFSWSPSSPAKASSSVFVSTTCIFSTISLVRLRVAIVGSSPKKGLPFTKILLTSLPFTRIFPSASTSTPGNSLRRSSIFASFLVLKEDTLNSKVSFLTVIGALLLRTTSPSVLVERPIPIVPSAIVPLLKSIVRSRFSYPKNEIFTLASLTCALPSSSKKPSWLVIV